MWNSNRLTKKLGIDYPIFQGPFGGGLSSAQLVSAVSNAGGLGGYGAYTLQPSEIFAIDKQLKATTDKPYNLNLWVSNRDQDADVSQELYDKVKDAFRPYFERVGIELPAKPENTYADFEDQAQAVIDARPAVFSFVFGIPSPDILEACRKRGIITVGTATTLDEALALESAGVDMIVAAGFESGGHRPSFLRSVEASSTGTFVLTQIIREKVKVPVIAAGGIATGRGVAAALTLGADGVQIGTAFLACDESGALQVHRDALFSDKAKYTTLTNIFTGRLGRGISTSINNELTQRQHHILPFPRQSMFMSSLRKAALEQNQLDMVFFWGGQIAPILKYRSVRSLMKSLIEETTELLTR